MNKEEYKLLLQREEWFNKRKIILDRDKHQCRKCKCKTNLHVHHKWYISGKKPWEVPNSYLITLCKYCHEREHRGKKISEFIKYPEMKAPRKDRKKKKKNNLKKYNNLSERDRKLQERYDALKAKNNETKIN